jgi:hypothetical protein
LFSTWSKKINGTPTVGLSAASKALMLVFALVMSLLSPATALAHHGFAVYYDVTDQVRVSGTIHQVAMKNPHTRIDVAVEGDDGDVVIWSCETTAKSLLVRKGISAEMLVPGDAIIIEGSRARDEPHHCEVGTMHLADGATITLRSDKGRANIKVVGTGSTAKRESVLGLWIRDSFRGITASKESRDAITKAGIAANAGYESRKDDPSIDCRIANPVKAFAAPGLPLDIRMDGDNLVIQHEFMDTSRIVYMDTDALPAGLNPSVMGHSMGRFDGSVLTVETSRFSPGVLLTQVRGSGVLHSEDMLLKETFKVGEKNGSLQYSWIATDPQYFGIPLEGELVLAPTTLEVGPYDCQRD